MRHTLLTSAVAMALTATGCTIAPQGRGGQSVTHDVVHYFQREWPLSGSPVAPPDACQGGCSRCGAGSCDTGGPVTWQDDWDQPGCLPHAKGYTEDPPPAVPLEPAPPGRFFPVPVKPAFAPQGPPAG